MRLTIGRGLRQAIKEARDVAEDAKALAYQQYRKTAMMPELHEGAGLIEREAGRLTKLLNEIVADLRGTDDGSQLKLGWGT